MKMKVSDYIAQFLVESGIYHVFTVTGGGAMHLNDALGHQSGLKCIYNHHEQACAIAAESYARINNKIAAVCVTTGPGGTNAITGVVGGYLDSIPMLILSGQVRFDTTARYSGLKIRALGDQEFDICKAIESMTKYCEMVTEPLKVRYCLEKALYIAQTGRPGPCWLDIPLDVQGAYIETDDLYPKYSSSEYDSTLPPEVTEETVTAIVDKIRQAKRPVIYAGNGIRLSGGFEWFKKVVDKLNVPVITGWNSIDVIYNEHPLYMGRGGIMGDRPGNFAVQNSDLVFTIGSRLSIRQVGYNYKAWAREAFVIANDIDAEELKKHTLHVEMPVWADAKDLLMKLDAVLPEGRFFNNEEWIEKCRHWKKQYPVVLPKHYTPSSKVNVYAFIYELSKRLNEGQITVVGNGSACVVGSQGYYIKKDQRFIINSAIASMGYDIPASIGAYLADPSQDIINITGDGSIQMNIQELQTVIHHQMPIKIFIINNEGYHSIRQTQKNFFAEPLVGIGGESKDLSFPDMSKLAPAYGFPYFEIKNNDEFDYAFKKILNVKGPVICEVFVDTEQYFEPKSATKRLEDGTLISAPLEDLAPFLSREELQQNMIIGLND